MASIHYRSEIDGLRALAVVSVVLFHLDFGWAAAGFVGVDMFFVVSGYLITSIAIADCRAGRFSLSGFWARRARRILAPAAVTVAATCIAAWLLMFGEAKPQAGLQALAGLGSVANLYFWRVTGDYWGAAAEVTPLLHMWSLSVEEQFYLVFPLVVSALIRRSAWIIVAVSVTLTVASFLLYLYLSEIRPSACFYLMPTRAWELGAGVVAALASNGSARIPGARWIALLGAAGVAASLVAPPSWLHAPGILLPAVAGTALMLAGLAGTEKGALRTGLSSAVLGHIGRLSYSIYLLHWPVIVFARYLNYPVHEAGVAVILCLLTYLLALASFHLVEQPIRRSNRAAWPIIGSMAVAAASAAVLLQSGRPEPIPPLQATWSGNTFASGPGVPVDPPNRLFLGVNVAPAPLPDSKTSLAGYHVRRSGNQGAVVMMGDSHGLMWASSLAMVCQDLDLNLSVWCAHGSSPFTSVPPVRRPPGPSLGSDEQLQFDRARLSQLESEPPGVLVLCGRWSVIDDVQQGRELVRHARMLGWRVLIVKQPPELWFRDIGALEFAACKGIRPEAGAEFAVEMRRDREKFDASAEALEDLCRGDDGCVCLETEDLFRLSGASGVIMINGFESFYIDDDHLSDEGARRIVPRLRDALQGAFLRR